MISDGEGIKVIKCTHSGGMRPGFKLDQVLMIDGFNSSPRAKMVSALDPIAGQEGGKFEFNASDSLTAGQTNGVVRMDGLLRYCFITALSSFLRGQSHRYLFGLSTVNGQTGDRLT